MAEGVVDVLETVEIDYEDRHRDPWPPAAGQGVLQPVGEQGSVGQPGQRIMQGLVDQLLLQLLVVSAELQMQPSGMEQVADA
jgi:hypothetical protein